MIRVGGRAELVELGPDLAGLLQQVSRVEADRAERGAGHHDGGAYALGNVVGVDEQGRARTQARHLGLERLRSESCRSVNACAAVPAVGSP